MFLLGVPPAQRPLDLPFFDACASDGAAAAAAQISGDVASATLSMLSSSACGRLNNVTADMASVPSALAAAPGSVQVCGLQTAVVRLPNACSLIVILAFASLSVPLPPTHPLPLLGKLHLCRPLPCRR